MRVALDTNILVSAVVFRSVQMNGIIKRLAERHSLILSSYVIDELHEVEIDRPEILSPAVFLKKY